MSTTKMSTWFLPLLFMSLLEIATSSLGDSSPYYNRCVTDCKKNICEEGKQALLNENLLSLGISLWSCQEDCEYHCQWKTVEAFNKRGWAVPQFKGKWPFIRLFGLEEPASVIFSMFNFYIHVKMIQKFRQEVHSKSPFYKVWHVYTLVHLNTWFWSSVFHTRDSKLTEKMDYISASSVVLYSSYTMGLRLLANSSHIKTVIWTVVCSGISLNHFAYLWSENFDYGYNMILNCAVGLATVLGWFLWTLFHYKRHPHAWRVALYALCILLSTGLEVFDFPPVLWTIDAHALWHLSTGFIVIIFYRFITEDCKQLHSERADKPRCKVE